MKAIEIVNPGVLKITDRPHPGAPADNEAVVRIRAVGICGSDVHIFHGRNPFATYPRIIGHEAAGEVCQVGSAVRHIQPGDGVAIDNVFACGQCYACKAGRANIIMEATGVVGVLEQAVAKLASQAGRVVILGFPTEPAKIIPADIMKRELDIRGSRLNNKQFPAVISWFARKEVYPGAIISHILPFSEVAAGLRLFDETPAAACKIILKF